MILCILSTDGDLPGSEIPKELSPDWLPGTQKVMFRVNTLEQLRDILINTSIGEGLSWNLPEKIKNHIRVEYGNYAITCMVMSPEEIECFVKYRRLEEEE